MIGIGKFAGIIPALGGGAGSVFPEGTILTQAMGILPIGTDISGLTADEVLAQAYAGFVDPQFTAFAIAQSTLEVGAEISGNKTFSWAFDLPENVADNTISILDVTGATTLASELSKVSPAVVDIGSVVKNTATFNRWKATAQDNQGNDMESSQVSVNWRWRRFWGFINNQNPDDATILAANSELSTSRSKSWNTGSPAGEQYFFFAYPASFGNLNDIVVNGFPSLATFTLSTRDFENAFGVIESYNIYVSNNLLANAAPIITS
tara:strand:+ start:16749 stop:17540 length:792 start_codon:yes stop_codon:yes gene_type:complete